MSGIAFLCVVAALAFLVALVGALRVPREAAGSAAKLVLSFAMLVYLFASVSNVLEHTGVTSRLDPFEDYAEILLFPFLLYFNYQISQGFTIGAFVVFVAALFRLYEPIRKLSRMHLHYQQTLASAQRIF